MSINRCKNCGSSAHHIRSNGSGIWAKSRFYSIQCLDCGRESEKLNSIKWAFEAWNRFNEDNFLIQKGGEKSGKNL